MGFKGLLAVATALIAIVPAHAQETSGTPAFRVPIGETGSASAGPSVFAWMQNVGTCSSTCGTGTRTTSFQCQDVNAFDFGGSGYGAPESDASCSDAGPKPAGRSASCTNYSGCSYDWIKPAVTVTRVAKPDPDGGTFPVGAADDCSHARRSFFPYCERDGSPKVVMATGDHQFCRIDTPDYDDVAAGRPDALGYDRTTDLETGCVAGARDHDWRTGAWGASSSTCSATPTQDRTVECIRRFNGASKSDASCAGIPKPATTRTVAADHSSCTKTWRTESWGSWSSGCSDSATRTRVVACRRSDGQDVADSECAGPKPATTETGSNLVSCSYSPRDMGRSACSAEGSQDQYWDCTRTDGQTGFPASYCGKTNPEALACTPPPPTYTYVPVNRGETACSNGTKQVYWDCTRNDGQAGFPASTCGKSSPETQVCVSYTPRITGESACSGSQKQVYWDCLGSDGRSYPASSCGKAGTETQSCVMPVTYAWSAGGWSGYSSGCSDSATRTRAVWCQGSDGQSYPDGSCGGGRPSSSESAGVYSSCTYTSNRAAQSACNNGQRTVTMQCQRSDGVQVSNSQCGTADTVSESCSMPQSDGRTCRGGTAVGQSAYGHYSSFAGDRPNWSTDRFWGTSADSRINCTHEYTVTTTEYGQNETHDTTITYYIGSYGTDGEAYYYADINGSTYEAASYNGRP